MRVAVLIVALCGALFVAMPVLGDEEEEAGRMPGDAVTEPESAEAPPVEAKPPSSDEDAGDEEEAEDPE